MKKCYFIHFDARKMPGVSKKIDCQLLELKKYFDVTELNVKQNRISFLSKACACLPFFYIKRNYKECINKICNASLIYIRNTIVDRGYIAFLKQLKKLNPKAMILIELPTHPHDKDEFFHSFNFFFFYKDLIYRWFYKKYIDRFVVFGDFDLVWGVPTIKTINGIDFSSVKKREVTNNNIIDLISVAQYQKHHAYERIIKGLYNYYKSGGSENIVYRIVGVGPSLKHYRKLITKYNLFEHVLILGPKYGKELDDVYDLSDISISTLGFHKIGVKVSSALKTREYLSKGLPIVYSGKIDIINNSFIYQCCFDETDKPIEIGKIVDLYNLYKKDMKKNSEDIFKYGEEHGSIEKSFGPILNYFYENSDC